MKTTKGENEPIAVSKNPANLDGVNLSGRDLSCFTLSEGNPVGAEFAFIEMLGMRFNGANLSGADLSDADLSESRTMKADFSGANLEGTNFSDVCFWF